MPTLEIVFIALALSIDAFAVALAASAAGRVSNPRAVFRLSFHFGLFQFLMPVLGWAAGAAVAPLIESFDHWVAFALLAVVGIRMIRSSRDPNRSAQHDDPSRGIPLLTLSTAVSIDALAVGLSLAMLRIAIWTPSVVIGIVTAVVTLVGITLGRKLHARFGRIAELIGGTILMLIAIRIVFSHMAP